MAKRIATSELTDRNWDQEEEEEEAGEFVAAKKDILKQRNIIKAKRRSNVSSTSPGSGLFAGFAGFSTPPPLPSANSSSSGKGSTISSSTPTTTTTTTAATTAAVTLTDSSSSSNTPSKPVATVSSSKNGFTATAAAATDSSRSDSKLHIQLKKLNGSVLQWIQQHVTKDPYCILTPIFKDYEKYLKTIQDESSTKADSKDPSSVPLDTEQKTSSLSAFENVKDKDQSKTDPKKIGGWPTFSVNNSIFSSGSTTTTTTSIKPTSISTTPTFSGFNFKPAETQSSFSFASSLATSNANRGGTTEEEDEYVPPKVEVKEIKEDGSVFSKRCKLYYEKDKNWIDKGIGNLHVKPFKDKAQLIIRADTNLGNILLNIMLVPTMQLKRQGKNNVSFVCIPNPPLTKDSGNKLVPLLLRVKTSEEADDLLRKLNTHKHGTDYEEDV